MKENKQQAGFHHVKSADEALRRELELRQCLYVEAGNIRTLPAVRSN